MRDDECVRTLVNGNTVLHMQSNHSSSNTIINRFNFCNIVLIYQNQMFDRKSSQQRDSNGKEGKKQTAEEKSPSGESRFALRGKERKEKGRDMDTHTHIE